MEVGEETPLSLHDEALDSRLNAEPLELGRD